MKRISSRTDLSTLYVRQATVADIVTTATGVYRETDMLSRAEILACEKEFVYENYKITNTKFYGFML